MTRPRLLITRALPQEVIEAARKRFEVKLWPYDEPIGQALLEWACGMDAVLVMATDRLDAAMLRQLSRDVRAIATYSVGYDHIDIQAANVLGLPVFHTPDVLSEAVAETALLLILSASRDASSSERLLRRGAWGPWSPTLFMGRQLTGRRLGIFGLGRIGRAIAARARPFGIEIHYHNRSRLQNEDGLRYHDTLESLLSVSDILCAAAPSTSETRGALDRRRLALLPRGAVFVNIARGDLVEEDALIEAVESGQIGALGLDVYQNEPHLDSRFLDLPRTTLLPHIGSATQEARMAMGAIALDALDQWLVGGRVPGNCLNPSTAMSALNETRI